MLLRLKRFRSVSILLLLVNSCDKLPPGSSEVVFKEYIIRQGQHYADGTTGYKPVSGTGMHFQVKFDSSCVYTTVDPVNQGDINKLYGFSDCETLHQENSARVGWLWNGTAIELHAYCYKNSVRSSKLLGTIKLGETKSVGIDLSGEKYVFTYEGKQTEMSRNCSGSKFNGYQLYPYFGGDETAPHQMKIYIRE